MDTERDGDTEIARGRERQRESQERESERMKS